MKKFLFGIVALALVLALGVPAFAATANPGPGSPGYQVFTMNIAGPTSTITSTITGIPWFKAPFPYRVVGIMTAARAGSTGVVNVMTGGVSLLTSSISVSTNYIDGTLIAAPNIADEASVTVNVGSTGSAVNDLTIQMILKRL
jgi:hypothetical protein